MPSRAAQAVVTESPGFVSRAAHPQSNNAVAIVSRRPRPLPPRGRTSRPSRELDRVEREDESIVEAVQKGVRSRLYDRGRYSPTRETGTHHFHRLLAEFLAPRVACG